MGLGDRITIDDDTLMIEGQELDLNNGKPDVAASILHRTGDTLVVIDTGVGKEFRAALVEAAKDLQPWSDLLVLTTHGHPDHVGNNDLADELAGDGANAQHYVPAPDVAQMLDPTSYWAANLSALVGVMDGFEDPPHVAGGMLELFVPMKPLASSTQRFEARPFEHLRLGPLHASGWSFCDGAVQVVRTQGHCAGQVVVHLRDASLLHLSDEPNGPCGAMHDADQLKILAAVGAALSLVEQGAVGAVTEGHLFRVNRGDDATARLGALLDQAATLDQGAHEALAGGSVTTSAFAADLTEAFGKLGSEGGNPNPVFLTMMAVNKLRELGYEPGGTDGDPSWTLRSLG